MDRLVKIFTISILCLVYLHACAAATPNKPIAVWEAKPSTGAAGSAQSKNEKPAEVAQNYSTAGYPRKTGTPYTIRGITYYPLQDVDHGYQEVGIASWYGTDFHSKSTANGEVYDMHDFTAAHKTLPMPTFVRVENLDNGKETVVRVNDRGPFSKGRIIDLSYAAANELEMVNSGTARVRITVLSESTDHMRTEGRDVDINRGNFAIQIGAYANRQNAERLAASHSNGAVNQTELNGRTLYRVQIKGFNTKSAAESGLKMYEKEFPGAFIISE